MEFPESRRLEGVSQEELAVALDLSNAFIRTFEGKILYWSSGSEKLYGWNREEVLGRSCHDLLRTRFTEPLQSIHASMKLRGEWSGNLVHQARDHRLINVYSHWVVEPGSPLNVVEMNVTAAGPQPDLAAVADASAEAVIGETLDGIVTSWNASAERLFEYTADEMIGRSVLTILPPFLADEELKLIAKIRDGARVNRYETTRIAKSGKRLTILLSMSPTFDFEGHLVGVSKSIRDLTVHRRQDDALRRSNSSLEEFVYAAAHDLQEPLRNISLSLQQLALPDPELSSEERAEMMAIAVRSSNRLQELIKDLLYFSRAIDTIQTTPAGCDADLAVSNARDNLFHAIHETNARLLVVSPLPAVAMHNAHLLQLMQNLIGNAIKYRKPSVPPVIRITAHRERSHIVFSISDNGIGIPPQYHQRIFGVFKRLDTSTPGNGIGLAVCRRIVEHYGGAIWLDSNEGRGATFHFAVPSLETEASEP